MGADRPFLLVDVDGVLNVYGVDGCPPGYAAFDLFPEDPEPVRLCVDHGRWLRELAHRFDLLWATGWGPEAPRLLTPLLGLHEFPFVPMPEIPFPPEDKVPAIASVIGDAPAAWLDDLVTPAASAWAAGRAAPTLLIEVDPTRGLERRHVDELLAWAGPAGGHGPPR